MATRSQTNISQKTDSLGGSSEAHSLLLNKILVAVSETGLARVWRSETGMAKNYRTGVPFKYGLKGSADITGILQNGKRIEIEIKTGNATQSKEQLAFAAMIQKYNGHYFVARDVESTLAFIHNCLK